MTMADLVQDTEWQGKALELRTTGLGTSEIGEAVGKHPATIRKLFARNPESEAPDRVLSGAEASEAFEGQTTVDECDKCGQTAAVAYAPEYGANFCETCAADPQAGAEYEAPEDVTGEAELGNHYDPLEDFRAEAGEAVGEMQERPGERPAREMDGGVEVDPPVFVRGTRQMALDFGENAAMVTGATLVLKSEKLDAGHFGLGDVISGTFTARIVATTGAEKFDKDIDDFVAKPTAQVALVTEIEVD